MTFIMLFTSESEYPFTKTAVTLEAIIIGYADLVSVIIIKIVDLNFRK